MVAAGIRDLLLTRSAATDAEKDMATQVYDSEVVPNAIEKLNDCKIDSTALRVQKVDTQFPDSPATVSDPSAIKKHQSLEYYWIGKRDRGYHKQLCLLKVKTDPREGHGARR